jgi:hypothetical protein
MSTVTDTRGVDRESLGTLHYAGVLLAVVSGVIHLVLGVNFAPSGLGIAFLFAGVGFIAASVAVLRNYRRGVLYRLGIPFTAGQIVLWYVLNFAVGPKSFPAEVGTLGAVDKVTQLLLLAVLVALLRRGE